MIVNVKKFHNKIKNVVLLTILLFCADKFLFALDGDRVVDVKKCLSIKHVVSGVIQGKITDAESGEELIGATVLLVGTSIGASTDVTGNYKIASVPTGTYQVSVSYIGYETLVVSDITINDGQTLTKDFQLKSAAQQLGDVVVTADRALSGKVIESTDLTLLTSIRNSSLITTGISSQQIARSADQDAGEVAKRLPGVSVLSNFVNIRGMHERYNLTILNGMVAPSSEADKRAFSYDLLPSNMIDKMTVYRSPAPELLADWAGGVIKIETKNSSVAREIEINLNTSYRSNSSFNDYYTYDGGSKDWMGMDDGTRSLPDGFPEVAGIPAGGLTDRSHPRPPASTFTSEELAANASLGKSLYNKWNLKKESSGLDYRAGINYYDSKLLGKLRISNLTSISTTQSNLIRFQEFNPEITIKKVNGEAFAQGTKTTFRDTISQKVSRWGLLQNLAFNFGKKHTIQLNGLLNQLGMDEVYVRDGFDPRGDPNGYVTKVIYTYRTRRLMGAQLAGRHTFGEEGVGHNISWTAAYNSSSEDIPAQRVAVFRPNDLAGNADENTPRYFNGTSSRFNINNSLFYSTSKEENTIYSLDYDKTLKHGVTIKAGFFNENKKKPLDTRLIRNNNVDAVVQSTGLLINQYNAENAFQPALYQDDGNGIYISDDSEVSGKYNARGEIYAGYAAVNLPLFKDKLKIYGGVRYEGQHLVLNIPPSKYLTDIGKKSELINRYTYYWLPSVNASWNFSEKILARVAYGKTINRPNYRELIPLYLNDPRLDNRKVGNDSLKDAQIHNFDFRLEYYPTENEFISVGVYYKKLVDAIEPYVESTTLSEDIYYDNTKKAFVLGIEAEIRKALGFIPIRWANRFSAVANFAILKSEIQLRDGLVQSNNGNFRDNRTSVRPLEGTAQFVVNMGLYYDHEKWKTKVSIIYNVIGQRLVLAGTQDFPETYELPRHGVDITFRQPITKFMEFRAGVQDVLNQPRRLYRDYDRDQRYDPDKRNKLPQNDWIYQQFRPGRYFTVGVNIKI